MRKKITEIISTTTFKDSAVSSFGTIANGLLGVVYYILMARFLGPADYGAFSVSVAAIALIASIANVGIDTGILRFRGESKYLKLALKIKLFSSVIVLVLGWFIVPPATKLLFAKPELVLPLRLALLGVATSLLFSFSASALQALEKFWLWSFLNIFSNTLRLLSAVGLLFVGSLGVVAGLYGYIGAPLIGFAIGFFFLPAFWKVKKEKEVLREFLNFNKWIALFTLIMAVASRMDTFLTTRLLTLAQVGIYSVAVSLTSIIPQIVLALASVVAPKLSRFTSSHDVLVYLKKLQIFVLGLAVVGVPIGILIGKVLINRVYGSDYLASFGPLVVLIFSQAIFLISVPVHTSINYYFSKPSVFVWVSLSNLVVVSTLGYFLIGKYNYMGAAATMLIGNVFNFVAPAIWVMKEFKKR
ncbi:oligosaccharide flippase family protein [Patescibacteria group bacterium]